MDASGITLQVLPNYQLKLSFPNGSEAVIDMKQRVHAIRFGRLSSPELFKTARLVDSGWDCGLDEEGVRANFALISGR